MFRIEGDSVTDLQSTFVENWLNHPAKYSRPPNTSACVADGGTKVLGSRQFAHKRTIDARADFVSNAVGIGSQNDPGNTPYFLRTAAPEKRWFCAIRARQDHNHYTRQTHRSSADKNIEPAAHGQLLKAGARIFEYKPSMIHAKVMIVDGMWCVVGSTTLTTGHLD